VGRGTAHIVEKSCNTAKGNGFVMIVNVLCMTFRRLIMMAETISLTKSSLSATIIIGGTNDCF
jgi:hypothetical protein